MLKVYDDRMIDAFPLVVDVEKSLYTIFKYNGFHELHFEITVVNPAYKYIAEQRIVEDKNNRYVVKKIDEHSNYVSVVCYLDLDDWKQKFFYNFRRTNVTISSVMNELIPQTSDGWIFIDNGTVTKRTTIEQSEGEGFKAVNGYDLLPEVEEAFGIVFDFDCKNRIVTYSVPENNTATGEYLFDGLNLSSIGFNGDSTNFATRVYAYGAKDETTGEPLTFESINGGLPYVSNHSYSDSIISVGFSDERFTTKEGLLESANKILADVSKPTRSYSCDVRNINLNIKLYDVVTLVDSKRKLKTDYRVVEYKEYQNNYNDVITLSVVPPKIETTIKTIYADVNEIKKQIKDIKTGKILASATANTPTTTHVTFDAPFAGKPVVFVNPQTTVPGTTVLGCCATNITNNGFDVILTRTSNTSTTVCWMAVGLVNS